MLELIEKGKGTIDWNADIPKRAKDAAVKGVGNDLPENSIWRALKLAKDDSFKDFKVDENTFKSMDKIRELAVKFQEGTKLDEGKVNADTITGEVLSIDYHKQSFFKEFKSRIGKDDVIWKLVLTGDPKKPTRVEYNLPNNESYVVILKIYINIYWISKKTWKESWRQQ